MSGVAAGSLALLGMDWEALALPEILVNSSQETYF